jgi:hypothetical protein
MTEDTYSQLSTQMPLTYGNGNGRADADQLHAKNSTDTIKDPSPQGSTAVIVSPDRSTSEIDDATKPEKNDEFLGLVGSRFDGVDVMNVIRNNYIEDAFFKRVLTAPKQFQNFVLRDKLLFLTDRGHKVLCIPEKVAFKGHTL